jgi:hypothetical protein
METLALREAARLLGVSPQRLSLMRARGDIAATKRKRPGKNIGFSWRFRRQDVERLAAERKKNPPQPGRPAKTAT